MRINFISIFICLLLLELFIGGSGQVFTIFGIPLRQVLFVLLMLIFIVDILVMRINLVFDKFSFVIVCLITWVLSSALIGLINYHDEKIIFADVSPMLYFCSYFPLNVYMKKYNLNFQCVFKLLVFSSFIVSLSIVSAYALLHLTFGGDIFLFSSALENTIGKEVFWFRSGGFIFYPGLFYVLFTSILLFGEIISVEKCSKYKIWVYTLGLISIVISMTKGLVLSLLVGHILIFFSKKYSVSTRLTVMFSAVIFTMSLLSIFDFSRFTQLSVDTGMINRFQVLDESLVKINEAVIFGNGFGTELPTKRFHQENSFIDIFVEQGLVGLFLYCCLIFMIVKKKKVHSNLVMAMLATVLMSFTNPAINNPLGIGILILTLIFIKSKKKRDLYIFWKA